MTLAKKRSRPIAVDAVRFRYAVARSPTNDPAWFWLNLTVQVEAGHGRVLQSQVHRTRDRWLDFPERDVAGSYPVVTPAQVAAIVRRGLAAGWNPQEPGAPFVLPLDADAIRPG